MSTPSIKSPTSPPPQWPSNDDRFGITSQNSEHGAVSSEAAQAVPHTVATNSGGESHESVTSTGNSVSAAGDLGQVTTPGMSYPIDENLFYSAPSQPLAGSTAVGLADADGTMDQEPTSIGPVHPPDFKPFFTLIEDPETGEHQHPTVHYVFYDDDPEILTTAALEALDKSSGTANPTQPDEVEQRYIVVDMAADGKSIISASSTSPDWQAVKTAVSQAPSWNTDSKSTDGGLMLKVSGQESRQTAASKEKSKGQVQPENLDDLVKTFSERLNGLDELLGRT